MQEKLLKERCIFLDIDGVANSDKTLARTPQGYIGISSDTIKLLKEIVEATGASIVLSSSWRLMDESDIDKKYLYRQLKYKGLSIVGQTKNLGGNRGYEISKYLEEHKEIKSFCILDDEFVREFEEHNLSKHFVHTDYTTGLTKKDVEKAIKILNGEFDYIQCEFSIEELNAIKGALFLCEDKESYIHDETYLQSRDIRNKINIILKNKNQENKGHFGKPLTEENQDKKEVW